MVAGKNVKKASAKAAPKPKKAAAAPPAAAKPASAKKSAEAIPAPPHDEQIFIMQSLPGFQVYESSENSKARIYTWA